MMASAALRVTGKGGIMRRPTRAVALLVMLLVVQPAFAGPRRATDEAPGPRAQPAARAPQGPKRSRSILKKVAVGAAIVVGAVVVLTVWADRRTTRSGVGAPPPAIPPR